MNDENKAVRALADRIISGAIDNAAPHPEVRDLLEHMVRNRTKVTDAGDLVVVDDQGVPRLSDRPGYPSLSLGEYLDELRATKPTMFANGKSTTGRGGPHTDPGNPFSKSGWNVTRQMTLMRSDPARAAKLQAEAGR